MQSGKITSFSRKSQEKSGKNIRQNAYEPCNVAEGSILCQTCTVITNSDGLAAKRWDLGYTPKIFRATPILV